MRFIRRRSEQTRSDVTVCYSVGDFTFVGQGRRDVDSQLVSIRENYTKIAGTRNFVLFYP
jgi:hypothetical protein